MACCQFVVQMDFIPTGHKGSLHKAAHLWSLTMIQVWSPCLVLRHYSVFPVFTAQKAREMTLDNTTFFSYDFSGSCR